MSVTCAPSAAYFAIVAPVAIASSSGCACTNSRRRSASTGTGTPYGPARIDDVTAPSAGQRDSRPSFPRQRARTRHFTAGAPRSFRIDPTGSRVFFLRSPAGDDPVASLWTYDVSSAEERLLVDPRSFGPGGDHLPPEERARRERAREITGGIVAYALDEGCDLAVFALAGRLHTVDIADSTVQTVPTAGEVFDPRPDPT